MTPAGFVEPEPEFFGRLVRLARRLRILFTERGVFAIDPKVAEFLNKKNREIESLWRTLEKTAFTLQIMAHKQLRGVPFNAEEEGFLTYEYGPAQGKIELYGGTAYIFPLDDAPRAADPRFRS